MGADLVAAYRELIADVYELAGRSRQTSDTFAARHGQSVARWHVLSVLGDGPRTVPQIADRLGLTRQSVQRVVNDLVGEELVALTNNPRHRRSHLIAMTPAGEDLAASLYEESSASRASALRAAGIEVRELDRARRTMGRLIEAIGEID